MPAFAGWLLIAPAVVLFLLSYVWPVLALLRTSFTAEALSGWRFLLSTRYLGLLGHALSYAVLPLLIIGVAAPAVAWLAARAGLVGRWAVRAAFVLPLAGFAPTGLALLYVSRNTVAAPESPNVAEPTRIEWDGRIALVATLGMFLLAVGVTCYLAVLRGRGQGETRRTFLIVGSLLAIVTLGMASQQYTFVRLVANAPGDQDSGATPMLALHDAAGSAPPVLFHLLLLGLLGLAAGLVVLWSGLRLRVDPTVRSADDIAPAAYRRPRLIGALLLVVALATLTALQLGPWLSEVATGDGLPQGRYPVASIFLVTWLIPMGAAVVQVGAAALAGFGIAVARPLGVRSDWLLLAFAPFLLVGNGLLELSQADSDGGPRILTEFAPPSWISVTAIFVFTLLFRGQLVSRAPDGLGGLISPALPMFLLVAGVALLTQAQDLLTPSLMDADRGLVAHGQVILVRENLLAAVRGGTPDVALGYPLWLLVPFAIGALVMQWAYLDRVAVTLAPEAALPGPSPTIGG
ncbi:MAG TPA: hypothetical protein VHJ83_08365 [Micromonosporaceae bacterium]|nr:hypothetical protein [Micromonosporaceae bacterium]